MSEQRNTSEIVREYYDKEAYGEWERLGRHSAEFEITVRFMNRYIKPGEKVLDVGGGPGRYSIYLAGKKCNVVMLDLSDINVALSQEKAREHGVSFRALQGDARNADKIIDELFDHVLIMGPLYHLLEEGGREAAVRSCLKLLKPGGLLYASYISNFAGMIYMMKNEPDLLASNPGELEYMRLFSEDKPFAGDAFTQAYFERWRDIEPFMARFGLEKLHLFGQEGILAPCENLIMPRPPEVVGRWLDLSEKLCEREDLLCFSEHIMYIGRKPHV